MTENGGWLHKQVIPITFESKRFIMFKPINVEIQFNVGGTWTLSDFNVFNMWIESPTIEEGIEQLRSIAEFIVERLLLETTPDDAIELGNFTVDYINRLREHVEPIEKYDLEISKLQSNDPKQKLIDICNERILYFKKAIKRYEELREQATKM